MPVLGLYHHSIRFISILPPHQLKYHQSGTRARDLLDRIDQETSVQPPPPPARARRIGFTLLVRSPVDVIVYSHHERLRSFLAARMGNALQALERFEVHVLDDGDGVLDHLLGNGSRDTG